MQHYGEDDLISTPRRPRSKRVKSDDDSCQNAIDVLRAMGYDREADAVSRNVQKASEADRLRRQANELRQEVSALHAQLLSTRSCSTKCAQAIDQEIQELRSYLGKAGKEALDLLEHHLVGVVRQESKVLQERARSAIQQAVGDTRESIGNEVPRIRLETGPQEMVDAFSNKPWSPYAAVRRE